MADVYFNVEIKERACKRSRMFISDLSEKINTKRKKVVQASSKAKY